MLSSAIKTIDENPKKQKAYYHLPGLFEFYEFYKVFLPLFSNHREYFYDWCEIGSIYGTPSDCLWGGGRVEISEVKPQKVFDLLGEYGISARLTFSNSLLKKEHLEDEKCNKLCEMLAENKRVQNGIIVHSDLLLNYLISHFSSLYFVSSTTKVLTDFEDLINEVNRPEFAYVVPDFRLNKSFDKLEKMSENQKSKIEFLVNECCSVSCAKRKQCYEEVSRINLGMDGTEHRCDFAVLNGGYKFSKAMSGPCFIGVADIINKYMPKGFFQFKIEGRGLGSAILLEFILHYMTKPECQLMVREEIYLDNALDLF